MANQIKTKYLGNDQVKGEKILLENNSALRAKDSSSATQDLLKIDASNKVIAYRDGGSEEIAYMSDVNNGGTALQDHIDDVSEAHAASAISMDPYGNLAATDVQAGLQELDDEKVAKSGDTMSGSLVVESSSPFPAQGTLNAGVVSLNIQDTTYNNYIYSDYGSGNFNIGSETLTGPYAQNFRMEYSTGKLSLIEGDTSAMVPTLPEHATTKQYVDDQVAGGGQALQDHINDITGAHAASALSVAATGNLSSTDVQSALQELQGDIDNMNASGVSYDNSVSMMSATNVQQGIDELDLRLDNLDASQVAFSPIGNISSVHVQTAIEELDTEKLSKSGDTMSGSLDMNGNSINGLVTPITNGQPLIYDQVGSANGVAPLNGSSKIDTIYLPSYVDDVEEYANLAAFPVSGESSKIYVALDSNKTYRWSGSTYVEISPSEVNSVNGQFGIVDLDTDDISEGANNLYYTQSRFDSAFSAKNTDNLSEGSLNLYFTDIRAKQSAVFDGITDGIIDVAPSQNAVFDALALKLDSSSFNSSFDTQLATKDTDDLAEGTSNLYFTDVRAKTAAVNDTAYGISWDGVIDVAPSKNAVYDEMELAKGRLDALEAIVWATPVKWTLDSTDISNGYIGLPEIAVQPEGMSVFVDRLALHQGASEDYTVSIVGGVTRITFLNDMVSPGSQQLAVGDSIYVRYQKNA